MYSERMLSAPIGQSAERRPPPRSWNGEWSPADDDSSGAGRRSWTSWPGSNPPTPNYRTPPLPTSLITTGLPPTSRPRTTSAVSPPPPSTRENKQYEGCAV